MRSVVVDAAGVAAEERVFLAPSVRLAAIRAAAGVVEKGAGLIRYPVDSDAGFNESVRSRTADEQRSGGHGFRWAGQSTGLRSSIQ